MGTTTKRAKKGGEFGANGEWYEGGKFINTVPEIAKREGSAPRNCKPRKVQIRPYVWAEAQPGQKPLFSFVGTGAKMVGEKMAVYLPPFESEYGGRGFCFGVSLEEMQVICDRFNNGEVWL